MLSQTGSITFLCTMGIVLIALMVSEYRRKD